jgi:hypothetical protein
MIDAAVRTALAAEGPAAFLTTGPGGPHLVATWQSYLDVLDDSTLAFPAGGYRVTEANLDGGSVLTMVIGSRGGAAGSGTGFRLTGAARLESGTPVHDRVRARFPWCRAAVVFHVTGVERILGS